MLLCHFIQSTTYYINICEINIHEQSFLRSITLKTQFCNNDSLVVLRLANLYATNDTREVNLYATNDVGHSNLYVTIDARHNNLYATKDQGTLTCIHTQSMTQGVITYT